MQQEREYMSINRDAFVQVAGVGACVADMLYTLTSFPTEDTKLRAEDSKMAGGGPVATGLVAVSKLGVNAAYLGVLSEDASGVFLKEDFEKYGVNTQAIVKYKGDYRSFTSSIWLNRTEGTRTCVFDRGNLPPYALNEEGAAILCQAKLLMVDGNELQAAIDASEYIHAYGGKVLYDAGGRYEGVERLLPKADILIPSAEFALGVTGEKDIAAAAVKLYETYQPEVVVITDGKNGGVLYQGESVEHYDAFKVDAVDSNGAGDVFHGAFAAAVVKGYSYRDCCTFASAVSAVKCTGFGARESAPDMNRLEAFLQEHNVTIAIK